jgi:histidine ammonia-lyase
MCAAQGLEFLRPLRSGRGVEAAFAEVRRYIPFAQADRLFHNDVQTALALVRSEQIAAATQHAAGRLL